MKKLVFFCIILSLWTCTSYARADTPSAMMTSSGEMDSFSPADALYVLHTNGYIYNRYFDAYCGDVDVTYILLKNKSVKVIKNNQVEMPYSLAQAKLIMTEKLRLEQDTVKTGDIIDYVSSSKVAFVMQTKGFLKIKWFKSSPMSGLIGGIDVTYFLLQNGNVLLVRNPKVIAPYTKDEARMIMLSQMRVARKK